MMKRARLRSGAALRSNADKLASALSHNACASAFAASRPKIAG